VASIVGVATPEGDVDLPKRAVLVQIKTVRGLPPTGEPIVEAAPCAVIEYGLGEFLRLADGRLEPLGCTKIRM
jgi:hypothetical protein